MTLYGFKDRETAVGLAEIYKTSPWQDRQYGVIPGRDGTIGYICRTPQDGIPSRSGEQCGEAWCHVHYVNPSGRLKPIIRNGKDMLVKVYNPFGSAIGGDRIITAKRVFGVIVVDAEDCA